MRISLIVAFLAGILAAVTAKKMLFLIVVLAAVVAAGYLYIKRSKKGAGK